MKVHQEVAELRELSSVEKNPVRSQWCSPGINTESSLRLLNLFINNLDEGVECTLRKFAGNMDLWGVADPPEGCAAIQVLTLFM